MTFNLSESTLKNIIEEVVGKYIELSTGDKFDLSKYLNKIPTEELRLQYVDYSNYDFIYGFDNGKIPPKALSIIHKFDYK